MTTSPSPIDLSAIRRMDAHVVHPWESFDKPNAIFLATLSSTKETFCDTYPIFILLFE